MARYREILKDVRLAFPQPTSDHIHDAWFARVVQRALDCIDDMKSQLPLLGRVGTVDYRSAQGKAMPEEMSGVEGVVRESTAYLEGITIWGHPLTQENVVPPTTIPSIVAMLSAAIYNPNVIWDAYSHRVAEAEVEATSMVASLVGYDPQVAGGVFTFGGTGANLYGVRLGLEKALPGAAHEGVRQDVKILCSDASHYSKLNVASWLGIGSKNVVQIPTRSNNSMDMDALSETLERLTADGHRVAAIIATMGTTDAFGIDPLESIHKIRNEVAQTRGLDYVPHIHADAVIGWPWSVFNDYDFAANPLEFRKRTLRSLQASRTHIRHLGLADLIGVDFHKTGYAPYTSSLILVRDRADFLRIGRDQRQMPYLYQFGEYHPGTYTLECSRSGGSILAALANLKLLGKQGYRVILGHVVEMAERLREQLEEHETIDVLNDYNHGSVTLFRVYPHGVLAKDAFHSESRDPRFRAQLLRHDDYSRRVFQVLRQQMLDGDGVNLSWTDCYRHTEYGEPIGALKSFIMSPFTDEDAVDLVVERVLDAQRAVD